MRLKNRILASLLALSLWLPVQLIAPGAAAGKSLAALPGSIQSGGATDIERPINKAEMKKRLDDYMRRIALFGFSGALLVAQGDEIIFNKSYGMADRDKGIPNTAETVFSTGSITKQFTAAAILKLEMQGKLNTADSISKHLEGVPEDKRAVTLHHLLTHTAGVLSTGGGEHEPNREQFVKKVLDAPLSFAPGERGRVSRVQPRPAGTAEVEHQPIRRSFL